jgi:hypothetical protein
MGTYDLASRLPAAFWMGVAVSAIALCLLGGFLLVSRSGKGARWSARWEAETAYEELREALNGFRHKYAALNTYSNTYFNTFHASGWDELRLLLDDLELAESSLLLLMERNRYNDVRDVSQFLLGRASPDEAQELMNRFEGLENIADWHRRSRDILLRVIQASMDSARKTASVGINRNKRSAKPTLVTLAELRSSLADSNN